MDIAIKTIQDEILILKKDRELLMKSIDLINESINYKEKVNNFIENLLKNLYTAGEADSRSFSNRVTKESEYWDGFWKAVKMVEQEVHEFERNI